VAERSESYGGLIAIAVFLCAAVLFGMLMFAIDSNWFQTGTGSAQEVRARTVSGSPSTH
jgi:hypothetical protein